MISHLIGIDPSFSTCGVAIYEPFTEYLELFSGDSFEVYDYLNETGILSKSIIVLENPDMDSTTFNMWGMFQKNLIERKGMAELQSQFRICMNYAQKAGQNKAAGKWFLQLFENAEVPVIQIAPSKRQRADKAGLSTMGLKLLRMPTKTSQEQFKVLTGFSKPSNEHKRDAALLVWGKSVAWAQTQLKMQK